MMLVELMHHSGVATLASSMVVDVETLIDLHAESDIVKWIHGFLAKMR